MRETSKTHVEFAWDGQDEMGKVVGPFSVTIEVDIS